MDLEKSRCQSFEDRVFDSSVIEMRRDAGAVLKPRKENLCRHFS
jgi:hypothetical protein